MAPLHLIRAQIAIFFAYCCLSNKIRVLGNRKCRLR